MEQRILLADTRHMVCKGLRDFLSHEYPDAFIEEATSSEAFVKRLANEQPYDVIIVQQSFLPEIPHPLKGILTVLANKPDRELFLMAHTYHARAYLEIGNEHLENLLRVALHLEPDEFLPDPAFWKWLVEQFGEHGKHYIKLELLTAREREIAELRNKGLSYGEIAKQLYIAVGTVKRHVANMRDRYRKE